MLDDDNALFDTLEKQFLVSFRLDKSIHLTHFS